MNETVICGTRNESIMGDKCDKILAVNGTAFVLQYEMKHKRKREKSRGHSRWSIYKYKEYRIPSNANPLRHISDTLPRHPFLIFQCAISTSQPLRNYAEFLTGRSISRDVIISYIMRSRIYLMCFCPKSNCSSRLTYSAIVEAKTPQSYPFSWWGQF